MKLAIMVICVGLLSAPVASATTYLIRPDGTGDFPTIQAAIAAASDGDVIELSGGTFTGDGNRDVGFLGKVITVRSQSGDPAACIIDCQGTATSPHRGFHLASGVGPDSRIEGITVTHGYTRLNGGGAVCCTGACPTIARCIFTDNAGWDTESGGAGGAVRGRNSTVTDCVFRGNRAVPGIYYQGGEGGAIASWGSATITGCQFVGNAAHYGGAIYAADCQITVSGCTFAQNDGGTAGGAAWITQASSGTLDHCLFEQNEAVGGSALAIWFGSSPTIDHCAFIANSSSYSGALDIWTDSSPLISACTFYGNTGPSRGTALRCEESSFPVVEHSIISFGGEGVPVWCDGTSGADLTCCDVYGNAGGDWVGCIASQYGTNGDFSADPLYCDSPHGDFSLAAISPCAPENAPDDCGLIGAWPVECEVPQAAEAGSVLSAHMVLSTPNPFVGGTMIGYRLGSGSSGGVSVSVYDLAGRLVRTLRGEQEQGTPGRIWWDGADAAGNELPGGIYLLRLAVGSQTVTERVIKIR